MSGVNAGSVRLAVCADDHGQNPAVSQAIDRLARRQRLTAASLLTTTAHAAEAARQSRDWPAGVQRGLHWNLTEGEPLSAGLRRHWPVLPSLPRLIALAHAGALPMPAIAGELLTQLARFVRHAGAAPQHIDGHQHVHHLPGLRRLVLDLASAQGLAVRNTGRVLGPGFALKRRLIEATGGRALQHALQARGLAHQRVLLGVHDFADAPGGCRARVQGWLATVAQLARDEPGASALLFCHPGDASNDAQDPIAAARPHEAAYLGSSAFTDDLQAWGVVLDFGPDASPRPRGAESTARTPSTG